MRNLAEANLMALIDSTEDMWGSVDLNYCMVVFNKNFERYIESCFGTQIKVGANPAEFLPPERAAAWPLLYQRALAQGPFRTEHTLLDGRVYEIAVHPILQEGKATGVSVYGRDISERKRTEAQLKDSEERYRATFEQASIGIIHTSFDGRYLRCNRRFAEIVGYSQEELAGLAFQQITVEEDREESARTFARLESGEVESISIEKRYLRKNGRPVWTKLTASIQRDGQGRPLHHIAFVEDIDDRKAAEERMRVTAAALRLTEERYRTIFQTSLDGITLSRMSDGMYIDVNKSFLDSLGYGREEVVGRTSLEVGIWTDAKDREFLMEKIRQGGSFRDESVQYKKKNGEILWTLTSSSAIEIEGVACLLSMIRDNSEARAAAAKIEDLAYYDPLTHLPNRRLLLERLHQAEMACQHNHRKCALLLIDLDNVKMMNETYGHHVGDMLLQEVGRQLTASVRETDLVARTGGDEFVVMLEELSESAENAAEQAKTVGEKLLAVLAEPFVLNGRETQSTCCIGIAIAGERRENAGGVLQQAEIAVDQAKRAGRNMLRFFTPALQAAVSARAVLEQELRQAIRQEEFLLYYQPQVSRGLVVGAEALVRWRHPQRGILNPSGFIPLAEETGQILELGGWVLETACKQIAAWARKMETAHLSVAVNISALQFRQPAFEQQILDALRRTGADPRKLKLELTESMLIDEIEEVIAKMTSLRSHEIGFSLDDFGTGYSSLSYLKRFPLDQLKIDRAFVRDILTDSSSGAIAEAIISLGKAMGMAVIAEGVESEEQKVLLARLGCHSFQCYLVSPPLPVDAFEKLLMGLNRISASYVL
ncbi:MAG: EAL domain-containing protein [Terracidiphilus sp.]|jgi:diguanylate cyclase (GGDEF)-like protein/PAS domain S-box-containing protein